jgi:CheY-like chemotaxis protein
MTKILIVEDEWIVAEAVSEVLGHAGHKVVGIARDEKSAVRQASVRKPDLVLIDINLADGSDGIETARRIQAERAVPTVFISAYQDEKTRARAAAVQPAGFLSKPFSPVELLETVASTRAD